MSISNYKCIIHKDLGFTKLIKKGFSCIMYSNILTPKGNFFIVTMLYILQNYFNFANRDSRILECIVNATNFKAFRSCYARINNVRVHNARVNIC